MTKHEGTEILIGAFTHSMEELTMDERLKHIYDNLNTMKIGLDDSFRFHCTQCGKCCINRDDILMTPRDLFRAASALNKSIPAMVDVFCDMYIGNDSRFPIVRLKPAGKDRHCPLLKNNRCSIHQAKPGVCAMYPIGRMASYPVDQSEAIDFEKLEIQYILQRPNCGRRSQSHTVREWLSSFDIDTEDQFFRLWQKVVYEAGSMLRTLEPLVSDATISQTRNLVLVMLYLNYDLNKDFMEQFKDHSDSILNLLHQLLAPVEKGEDENA